MRIDEVIKRIKRYYKGTDAAGNPICEAATRDQILYGDADKTCTGIVTTCFASADVIRKAHELGANLIICHEALFWNRGDRTDWLSHNGVFREKKRLLDETGITVWRNHDYIHSGLPLADGGYADGIFYGFMKVLGWEDYLSEGLNKPLLYQIPEITAEDLGRLFLDKLHLNGIRLIGDREAKVKKVFIAEHIMGRDDDEKLKKIDSESIDAVITMELTDYTVSEYIRDASQLGMPKAIMALGHFNTEEPGMQYMAEYLPGITGSEIPVAFIQSGDAYSYLF